MEKGQDLEGEAEFFERELGLCHILGHRRSQGDCKPRSGCPAEVPKRVAPDRNSRRPDSMARLSKKVNRLKERLLTGSSGNRQAMGLSGRKPQITNTFHLQLGGAAFC